MKEPRLIELTCYRVLAGASGDGRAAASIARAHAAVQAHAATIADAALRRGYLENPVPPRDRGAMGGAAGRSAAVARIQGLLRMVAKGCKGSVA